MKTEKQIKEFKLKLYEYAEEEGFLYDPSEVASAIEDFKNGVSDMPFVSEIE